MSIVTLLPTKLNLATFNDLLTITTAGKIVIPFVITSFLA
jgi:hypothetical protein